MGPLSAALFSLALILGAPKASAGAQPLVGTWALSGAPFVVFNADGTGSMGDEHFTWKSDGKVVTLTSSAGKNDRMAYSIADGHLALVAGGVPMALTRTGTDGAPGSELEVKVETNDRSTDRAAKSGAASSSSGAVDVSDGLSRLLLASPWCDARTGTGTAATRLVFRKDGTFERTHPGSTDTNDGAPGRWKVDRSQLYMGEQKDEMSAIQLFVKRNAHGAPIVNVNGDDYTSCR